MHNISEKKWTDRASRNVPFEASPYSNARWHALAIAARTFGAELSAVTFVEDTDTSTPALIRCAASIGLQARAQRVGWSDLIQLGPVADRGSVAVILLLRDGGAAVLAGSTNGRTDILVADPESFAARPPVAVDEIRLREFWDGNAILLRPKRAEDSDTASFGLAWLLSQVLKERRIFRDVAIATLVMSGLALVPPMVWMTIVDRVVVYRSEATLELLAAGVAVTVLYEAILGHAQRLLTLTASVRIDTRLNLHILSRLLKLPLEYFERNSTGEITHRLAEAWRVRDFLTGRLFRTLLDTIMLMTLVPVLFLLHPTLTWIVLGCGALAALVVATFVPSMRRATGRVMAAETQKHATLIETVHGIRTVKTLALEQRQLDEWDERVAVAAKERLKSGTLASWPQTLIVPIERFMYAGTLTVGAALALQGDAGITNGALMAFAMLSGRVAAPLVGVSQLLQELEEVKGAVAQVSRVLDETPECAPGAGRARPMFAGNIIFEDVSFQYPGASSPALEKLTFSADAGTLIGLVGRSGSGKSTVTRLLQGVSSGHSGLIKIDGVEIRELDLHHLRRRLGVVLQDNFLFRGTVRENIAAGRPGITFNNVVRASRLAGAEEFIERLPGGYDTWIEEGSPNLSGGQRQRLAIARALVTDPAILILDEATSALDPESEAVVNANLLRIAKGRTVIVVSHRLSSLVDCDQILVLDRGRLLDAGRHQEILERCSTYRQLWQQQHRGTNFNASCAMATLVSPKVA